MAKGFRIPLIADVKEWLSGTNRMGESLDDVADSLDDLARDAQRRAREMRDDLEDAADRVEKSFDAAGDEIETALEKAEDASEDLERAIRTDADDIEDHFDKAAKKVEDAFEDAEKAVERHMGDVVDEVEDARKDIDREAEKLERSFKEAFEDVEKKAKQAGDEVGDNLTRGARKARDDGTDAVGEFKDEATQNFSEVASSFSGDMDSAVDLVQGTLGGLASSLGPAGFLAAGAGAAAGAFYTKWQENAEKTEQRIRDMYDDMVESGNDYLSTTFINENISKIISDDEDAILSYADAQKVAELTGLDLSTVLRGYAGDAEAALEVDKELGRVEAENVEIEKERRRTMADKAKAYPEVSREAAGYRDVLKGTNEEVGTAAEKARAYRDSMIPTTEATRDFTEALAEQDDILADAKEAIAENNETIKDSEQRAIDNKAALSEMVGSLVDVQEAAREAGVPTKELTDLQYDQALAFVEAAKQAGIEEDAALDLARQLGLIPEDVATDIKQRGADAVQREARETKAAVDRIPNSKHISVSWRVSAYELQAAINSARNNVTGVRVPISFYTPAGSRYVP